MKTEPTKITAVVSLLASAIIIGFSYVALKTGLKYASPFWVLIDRLVIALLVIFIIKKAFVIKVDKISKKQKNKLFFLSALYPIAFFLFQNFGIKYVTASETSIIYSLVPIFTTIASAILLKEKTTLMQKFGILLSFCGIAYISFHSFSGFSDSATGYVLIFCSLLSMVFYYVFLKKSVAKISPVSITYYLVLFATLSLVTVYLGWALIHFQALSDWSRWLNCHYIWAILYLGILSTLGTSLLTSIGIKKISAVQTSIFSNISPLFGVLAGVLIMNDVLQIYQIIGSICIFAGVFISLKYTRKPR